MASQFTDYSGSSHSGRPQLRFGPGRWGSAIKWLVIANAACFLVQMSSSAPVERLFGLTPAAFYADFPNKIFQPFSYMFLHGSFFHILINMLFLWMFGVEIERMWGARRFVRFYLLAGLSGAFFSLVFSYASPIPIIGASGAVFGIMAAYWRYFPDRYLYIYFILPVKVRYAIPAMLIIPMLATVFASQGGIAHFAHLGGAVYGFLATRRQATGGSGAVESFRSWRRRRKHDRLSAKQGENRRQAEDVMRRVDAILDKINEVGLENLTPEERKFLEEASQRLSRDKRHN